MYHNSSFENYFGNDVTPTEVKNLLSTIRTNNLVSTRHGEVATIGVCFISNNVETVENYGIYNLNIDSDDVTKATFDNLYFSPEIQEIASKLKAGTSYRVNTVNTKVWSVDEQNLTGFEYGDNKTGQLVQGSSGGYYSNGYIRLIYIAEN